MSKITAETITVSQIDALETEAATAGDHSMVDICSRASQLLRARSRGMAIWGTTPKCIQFRVDVINEARANQQDSPSA